MNLTHKYLRTFLLGFQAAIEYRANFILSILTTFLQIIVQLYLWSALFSNSTDDRIYNFTKEQMMFYVLFAALVSRFIRTGFEYEVVSDIKNGGIDKFFVRPVGYIMYRLSAFLGKTMSFTIPMLVIMGGCLFFLSHIFLQNTLELTTVILFVFILILALIINFIIFLCIGLTAFWFIEVNFFFEAFRIIIIIASGGIFPLDIFGDTINQFLEFLPFKYTVYFPVDVISGRLGIEEITRGMLTQLMWIIILATICNMIWRVGSKKYVSAGG